METGQEKLNDSLFLILIGILYLLQAWVMFKRGDYAIAWLFFGYVVANCGLIIRYW